MPDVIWAEPNDGSNPLEAAELPDYQRAIDQGRVWCVEESGSQALAEARTRFAGRLLDTAGWRP